MPQSYIFSAKLFALRRQTNASRLLLLTQNSPIIANIRKTYSNNHNSGSEYLLLSSFNDNFGLKQNFRCMDFSKSVKFAA